MQYKRLSTKKASRILRCFCLDVTATAAAELAGVNRKTADSYYNEIRQKILKETLREGGKETGEFEADESYFGAGRGRGQPARPRCSAF